MSCRRCGRQKASRRQSRSWHIRSALPRTAPFGLSDQGARTGCPLLGRDDAPLPQARPRGMKELKVEMARSLERAQAAGTADINFPFGEGWTAGEVAASIRSVFEQTLAQTQSMLDMDTVEHAASLICTARRVGLFTESHNLYPASMFSDRLLSVGIDARCEADTERQIRCALLMGKDCVAIGISYSGVSYARLRRAFPCSQSGVSRPFLWERLLQRVSIPALTAISS